MKFWSLILAMISLVTSPRNIHGGTVVQIRMPIGDVELELFDDDKPITVQNFLRYLEANRYVDSFLHRWEPGFVIQGGGFYTSNRVTATPTLAPIQTVGTIQNEYAAGRVVSNGYGTVAMARVGGQTNSATSQWFINLADNRGLDAVDGGFTVFGRVIGGTNVLNRFNLTTRANAIFRADAGGALNHLPVLSTNPTIADLVYTDVTILNVRVQLSGVGERDISWNSVSNKVNVVEFTEQFPPQWQTLVGTNGNGGTLTVSDPNHQNRFRFYRIRIEL